MSSIALGTGRGKLQERPAPCRECATSTWWDGTRKVSAVRLVVEGVEYIAEIIRRRARCPSKDCPVRSWTVYERDSYPHRVFDLAVVVSAVSAVTLGAVTLATAARAHQCSRDSVRRWKRWVGSLADPQGLLRTCTRLDADGMPGGRVTRRMGRAGKVMHLLDRLAELVVRRGGRLPQGGCGLSRILAAQLQRFGAVFYLTKLSPPLRSDWASLRL